MIGCGVVWLGGVHNHVHITESWCLVNPLNTLTKISKYIKTHSIFSYTCISNNMQIINSNCDHNKILNN